MLGYRARDGSGNPTLFCVDCSVQPDLKFSANAVVSQNAVNEGRAQKNKNTIFVPNLIKNQ
jgi:hypothetical protein